jgi:hypothetical protein
MLARHSLVLLVAWQVVLTKFNQGQALSQVFPHFHPKGCRPKKFALKVRPDFHFLAHLMTTEHFRCKRDTTDGKLGEYSDKLGSIIGNLAEYWDKSANAMADAASRAEASLQLMERGIASYTMKNIVLPEISLALEMCPNLHPTVFGMKIRTRSPRPSICVRIFTQFTN